MTTTIRIFSVVLLAAAIVAVSPNQASAQYPVSYTTTTTVRAPQFVGYQVQRYGLLGLRADVRPVYTPQTSVTTVTRSVPAPAPVTVTRPVYYSAPVAPQPVYYSAPAPTVETPAPLPTTTISVPAPVVYTTAYVGT